MDEEVYRATIRRPVSGSLAVILPQYRGLTDT